MKKIITLGLLTISIHSFAEGNNLYLGGAAGFGWNTVQTPDATFRINGGFNVSDNWAFEVGDTILTQSGSNPNQGMQYYDLSIKGTVSFAESLDGFIQLGGAYGTPSYVSSASNTSSGIGTAGWNFLTGLGVDFIVTHEVSLNVSDLYYYGSPTPQGNTNVLLGGIKFSF